MAGCFGNDPFDRHIERETLRYLDSLDRFTCPKCGWEGYECDMTQDDYENLCCPECGYIFDISEL